MATFVLVHGMAHGAWCWERTIADLQALGHVAVAVDLPLTHLVDDAEVVRRVLDAVRERVVLVGHSYGGLVISMAAGDRSDVDRLVYVAAAMLDGDDILMNRASTFPASLLGEHIELTQAGSVVVSPEGAIACFYNECPDDVAADAAARMRPTAVACLATAPGAEPWRTIPSTYVLCERDRAIHPEFQQWMSQRASEVNILDTDHSPFLSVPQAFVELLDRGSHGVVPTP